MEQYTQTCSQKSFDLVIRMAAKKTADCWWGNTKKEICVFWKFKAQKAEVAVPCLAVQLGLELRKAQSLVNVGGEVDFIQANMFLDPEHLSWITRQTADREESLEQTE